MADKLDKTVRELQEELESVKKNVKKVESDIYSPSAQVDFAEYKGTYEQYVREAKLRQVAAGKKDTPKSQTLRLIAAAVFGDRELTQAIRERYQERYTREEIASARKTLEEEFGVKKKKDQSELAVRKFRKIVKDEISPIKESILGIAAGVDKVGKDIERANRSIKSISDNLIGTINKTLTVMAGGGAMLDRTPERLKPMTVTDEEGKQYLFYPEAPEGRQLYEKSKTGTAGRIASKKIQRKLNKELKRLNREEMLKPVRTESTGEESSAKKKSSIFDLESDEQQYILRKVLRDALEDVFTKNPELLKRDEAALSGIVDGLIGGALSSLIAKRLATSAAVTAATGAATSAATTAAVAGGSAAAGAAGGAAASSGTGLLATLGAIVAPVLGSVGATIGTFGAIDYGMKSSANKVIAKLAKDSPSDIATAIQVPKYGAYTLQELEKMSVNDPTLKKKLDQAKIIAGIVKPAEKPELVLNAPSKAPVGQQIVDQNQKRIEINSADKVEIPAQTVNQYNTTSVIPVPSGARNIEVHNQENTFNRLLAQEFDHPATYASMNMG